KCHFPQKFRGSGLFFVLFEEDRFSFKKEECVCYIGGRKEGDGLMRRKYGRLRKKGNMIVFPGTYEMLVEKGYTYVERAQFDKAVEAFDQAVIYEPDSVEFLGPYAVALYET